MHIYDIQGKGESSTKVEAMHFALEFVHEGGMVSDPMFAPRGCRHSFSLLYGQIHPAVYQWAVVGPWMMA